MEKDDWFYYEDVVEVIEDIFNFGGQIKARSGQRGMVMSIQHEERDFIDIRFDGRSQWLSVPTWKLQMIAKNNERRRIDALHNEELMRKMKRLKIDVGNLVNVLEGSRIINVLVSRVLEDGMYGYRMTADGERYRGKFGQETYFTPYSLIEAEPSIKESKYSIGDICLSMVSGRNVIEAVGQVVRVTSKTIHVSWGSKTKPVIYSLYRMRLIPEPREKIQQRILEKINDVLELNQMTEVAKNRFIELGFDVLCAIVQDHPHYKR